MAHGASVGLAIDILCAADIRYASKDAVLSVREVNIGLAADIGTLQRLPKIANNLGWVKEVSYTARDFGPDEARSQGLIDSVFETKDEAVEGAIKLASAIAAKSPVAIYGTKKAINYAVDHPVDEGLKQIAAFNGFALGEDLLVGMKAARAKEKPKYKNLAKL